MAQDLSGLYISQSFQNLVQRSASGAFNVLATATGTEFIPVSASYAISASKADSVVSASYAVSSSRAVSASRADSALSASYALSASHAPDQNLQSVLTAGNQANLGFSVTGSTFLSGSLVTGNGNNLITKIDNAIIGGNSHTNSGASSVVVGGVNNDIQSGAERNVIAAGESNTIQTGTTWSSILGGTSNTIQGGKYNSIIGGENNLVQNGITGSVVAAGNAISGTQVDKDFTLFTSNIDIQDGGDLEMSGSIKLASSTGSVGQVIGVDAAGNAKWETGAAVDPFPFTGSAQITGSLIVTGSVSLGNIPGRNTINASAQNAFVVGDGNAINGSGEDNVIVGGETNAINSGAYSAIIGAAGSSLTNVDTSIIAGGYQNTLAGTRTFILGGNQNTVASGTEHSGVIGGQFNQVNSNITGSVVIGGKNIGADKADTVFVPALNVGKGTRPGDVIVEAGSVNVTGSIVGSTSIFAGQNAAAFSSDAVRLGNATTPVQYGNMIIHTDTSGAMLGNQYNAFTIDDPGTSNIQFASSAFTGLGNTVHMLAWGGTSVGRADTIKLWSSGSAGVLNASTDLKIQDGNKLTMSGSIELASSTGSVGQVIGVDASGKAKWETAAGGAAFPFTGSAQITGSLAVTGSTVLSTGVETDETYPLEILGNAKVRKNVAGQNATLVIQDDAQSSFTEGPTLQFSGSNVGLLKSDGQTNVRFETKRDFEWVTGTNGGGAQFSIVKENQVSGDFKIEDKGSRSARYIHENLNETGSIRFANTTTDAGIALRMDDDKMGLQMYSGSAFVPIIQRASGSKQVNLYDSSASTGSSAQVLTSNANGGIEWAAAGGGGGGGIVSQQSLPTDYTQATAPGCDTIFQTASIAGGTYTVGDVVEVRAMDKKTSSSGTTYTAIYQTPGNVTIGASYASGNQIAGNQTSGDGAIYYQKTLHIISATETAVWIVGNGNETYSSTTAGGDPIEIYNIDWTQDQTIWYGACIDNAGTRLQSFGLLVRKLNG